MSAERKDDDVLILELSAPKDFTWESGVTCALPFGDTSDTFTCELNPGHRGNHRYTTTYGEFKAYVAELKARHAFGDEPL